LDQGLQVAGLAVNHAALPTHLLGGREVGYRYVDADVSPGICLPSAGEHDHQRGQKVAAARLHGQKSVSKSAMEERHANNNNGLGTDKGCEPYRSLVQDLVQTAMAQPCTTNHDPYNCAGHNADHHPTRTTTPTTTQRLRTINRPMRRLVGAGQVERGRTG